MDTVLFVNATIGFSENLFSGYVGDLWSVAPALGLHLVLHCAHS